MRRDESRIALELGATCLTCDCGKRDGISRGRVKAGQVLCTRNDRAVNTNGVCAEYTKLGASLHVLQRSRIGERMRVDQTDLFK